MHPFRSLALFQPSRKALVALAAAVLGYIALCFFTERIQVAQVFALFGLLFGTYFYVSSKQLLTEEAAVQWGMLFRLIAFFAMPNLSDDLFRFVWDGRLLSQGINPFLHLPGHYMEVGQQVAGLTPELYQQLNSPDYYTVYPPISQLVYAAGAFLFPNNLYGSVLVMKFFILLAEFGSLVILPKLLKQLGMKTNKVIWYALNPLVIVECCGNLHFEALMLFFLLAAMLALTRGSWKQGALWMAMSIGIKIIPLMFLPFLIRRLGWGKSFLFFVLTGLLVVVQFLPFLSSELIANFGSSLDLYFQKFEFNASFYYVMRWIGMQATGYNLIKYIGPALSAIVVMSIFIKTIRERKPDWANVWLLFLFAQTVYYLSATIVHPWYLCSLVLYAVFTSYRFPMLWSCMAIVSYFTYRDTTYTENLWLTALEYTAVLAFLYAEWRFDKPKPQLVENSASAVDSL